MKNHKLILNLNVIFDRFSKDLFENSLNIISTTKSYQYLYISYESVLDYVQ